MLKKREKKEILVDKIRTLIGDFTIRFAEEKDASIIFGMVKELAEYEKLLDSFEATIELFRESLFGRSVAEALIGEYRGRPVGYAIFFHNFSTFKGRIGIFIEDVYVKPELRGRGFGEAMFSFIAKLAIKRKCGRVEWACLNWNEPSISFYKKLGAVALDDWKMFRLEGNYLKRAAEKQS
jgi:GNAT superfamily N-acetyltransferase